MYNNKLMAFLALSLLLSTPAAAEVILTKMIPASQDATLIEDPDGARADGSGPFFRVGMTGDNLGGGIRRGLLLFDMEGEIPANAQIEHAALHLHVEKGGPGKVRLYRVLQDWGEGTSCANGGGGAPSQLDDATWIHTFYDETNSMTWDTAGGDRSRPASARESVDLPGSYTWSSNRMKRDVQQWIEQPGMNFGWLLIGDENKAQSVVAIGSREAARCDGMDTGLQPPMLEVMYSLPDMPE